MLLQADLFLTDPEKIRLALEPLDCRLVNHPTQGNFWEHVPKSTDILIIDLHRLPQPFEESVETLVSMPGEPDVIVLVEDENAELRAQLMSAGCLAVINTNLDQSMIDELLESLVARTQEVVTEQIESEFNENQASLNDFDSNSPRMAAFIKTVRRVVSADSSLLILGETGVGKERLARAIHEESPRKIGPFVPVNCAAFPESLLEGELFGHDEGAFTGATGDRRGYFEMAHGGTLFLDEIGEVPRHVQVKLLRVLQERCIQRLGSETEINIDVRIVAATNRDLNDEIESRRFRRDLYYRLSVVTLEVPPLRDHPEDISTLLNRYLDEFRLSVRNTVNAFSEGAMECLCRYHWPGNVRELINVVERAVLLCEGSEISVSDLPPGIAPTLTHNSATVAAVLAGDSIEELNANQPYVAADSMPSSTRAPLGDLGSDSTPLLPSDHAASHPQDTIQLPDQWQSTPWLQVRNAVVANLQREYLTGLLTQNSGRVKESAQQAGLSQRSLYVMLKKQQLDHRSFRPG